MHTQRLARVSRGSGSGGFLARSGYLRESGTNTAAGGLSPGDRGAQAGISRAMPARASEWWQANLSSWRHALHWNAWLIRRHSGRVALPAEGDRRAIGCVIMSLQRRLSCLDCERRHRTINWFLLKLGSTGAFLPNSMPAANGGKVHLSIVEQRGDLVCRLLLE